MLDGIDADEIQVVFKAFRRGFGEITLSGGNIEHFVARDCLLESVYRTETLTTSQDGCRSSDQIHWNSRLVFQQRLNNGSVWLVHRVLRAGVLPGVEGLAGRISTS